MYIANIILPLIVLFIVIYGIYKKVNVFDVFIEGAKEGLSMTLQIFPTILAMIVSINIFLKSNILQDITIYLKPFFDILKFPSEILPLAILRPISGSSSLIMLNNILSTYGVDSYIGRVASVIQGSTDTTIYILGLYFGSIGIKKIRYSLLVGLLSDLSCIIISLIVVSILF